MWEHLSPIALELVLDLVRHGRGSSIQDVPSLACVCRKWAETVLGVLWRETTITRFLCTLADDLCACLSRSTCVDDAIQLIQHSDITRFIYYGRKIIRLAYDYQPKRNQTIIPPWAVIALCNSWTFPLPNLERIDFSSADREGWYVLPHLVSPRTSSVVLDLHPESVDALEVDPTSLKEVLSRLSDAAIDVFIVRMKKKESATLAGIFTEFIPKLPTIRKLQIPLAGASVPNALYPLCLNRSLAAVDFQIYGGTFDLDHLLMPPSPFPNLRTLHLASTISFYLPLIQSIQSTLLNCIRLSFVEHVPCPSATFHSLIQATCSATTSLRTFELTIKAPSSHRTLSNLPTAAVFLPLLAHRKLEELRVDLGVPVQMTDGDIDTISYMWPHCRKLKLVSNIGVDGLPAGWKPMCTFRGLAALLFHLRHIRELVIEFDATTLEEMMDDGIGPLDSPTLTPDGESFSGQIRRTSQLRVLEVGHSPGGEPSSVAGFIGVLCPKLLELKWLEESEKWARTQLVLNKIRDVRSRYL